MAVMYCKNGSFSTVPVGVESSLLYPDSVVLRSVELSVAQMYRKNYCTMPVTFNDLIETIAVWLREVSVRGSSVF